MPEAKTTLPRFLVAVVRSHAALGAAGFFCSFADWTVFKPLSLPPVALTIVVAGVVFAAGLGAVVISLHEGLLRMLRQRPDAALPIARWTISAMMLSGALPVARFGYPFYWLLAAATPITGLIALIALQKFCRSNATSA